MGSPSATILIDPMLNWVGQNLNFSAVVNHTQPIASYNWGYGDGSFEIKTTSAFSRAYTSFGLNRNVTLVVTDTSGLSSQQTSASVTINRLPSITYTGILSANENITFTDISAPYFPGTVISADWDFGDSSTSSTTNLTATMVHKYSSLGSYEVSVTAYDISGNEGVGTTTVPLFSNFGVFQEIKCPYINLCGPSENGRFGANRNINLVEYLPIYLRGGETESFTQLFEDFLNEMFDGLGGFETTTTELGVTQGYENVPKVSASEENWPRENTYYLSATSATEETNASIVEQIAISQPSNTDNQKISILEKVQRITELHDPDLIDLEYIQYFANNLGYDIDINRDEVGISGTGTIGTESFGDSSGCVAANSNKYLRFTISNLPTWYKIKSTNNAIKVMLYSFGLIGELIEYYTNNYLPSTSGGNWILDYTGEFSDIPDGWYPTPHFAISINIDDSINISDDVERRQKIINAIESIRPINTVFENLSANLKRFTTIEVSSVLRMRRYINIEPNGFANDWWDGTLPAWYP